MYTPTLIIASILLSGVLYGSSRGRTLDSTLFGWGTF